jgi:hypothetical protein
MHQGTSTPLVFHNFKIIKGYIKGRGADTVGQYEIVGQVDSSNQAHFLKQYIGAHSVEYHGAYNKKKITGHWSMPMYAMSDTFTISRNFDESSASESD